MPELIGVELRLKNDGENRSGFVPRQFKE